MPMFNKKAFMSSSVEGKHKKKIPPAGAWGYYRNKRPYPDGTQTPEKKLLIDVNSVSLAYEGRTVISELSMQVYSGDYICIVGENGSGKTTLMNGILGLKKPSGGEIKLEGLKMSEIGVLPQKTPVQNDFCALVSEIVLSGRVGKKKGIALYNKEDRRIAFENMEKLGITSIARTSFRELSGGQQQRVLLARALCAAEKLLVLDEPVAGLDPKAQADMYDLIYDINRRENIAIIMVSHDVEGALEHANKVLHISKNSMFFGTKEEYFDSRYGELHAIKTDKKPFDYKYTGGDDHVQD